MARFFLFADLVAVFEVGVGAVPFGLEGNVGHLGEEVDFVGFAGFWVDEVDGGGFAVFLELELDGEFVVDFVEGGDHWVAVAEWVVGDFVLEGVMTYDFENISLPGPDGNYDQVDDFSVWALRPHLSDNLNDLYGHMESELDR